MAFDIFNPFNFLRRTLTLSSVMRPTTIANVKAANNSGTTYTFSGRFRVVFNKTLLNFEPNETYILDASNSAAVLAAASAAGVTATAV